MSGVISSASQLHYMVTQPENAWEAVRGGQCQTVTNVLIKKKFQFLVILHEISYRHLLTQHANFWNEWQVIQWSIDKGRKSMLLKERGRDGKKEGRVGVMEIRKGGGRKGWGRGEGKDRWGDEWVGDRKTNEWTNEWIYGTTDWLTPIQGHSQGH